MPIKQKTKHRKQLVSLIRTNTKIDVWPFPLQTKSKTKQTTGNEVIQFIDKHHFFLLSLLCFAFCFVLFYQELKSNESKNEREEKKGLKNKKKQKKELNDTAS